MLHRQPDRSHPAKDLLGDPFGSSELLPTYVSSCPVRDVWGKKQVMPSLDLGTDLDPISRPGRRMIQCSKSSFLKSSSNSPLIWGYPIIEFAFAPPEETRIALHPSAPCFIYNSPCIHVLGWGKEGGGMLTYSFGSVRFRLCDQISI